MLKINELSQEATAMRPRWAVVEALMGGTWAMRAAREQYLQRWPQEDQASYDYRLQTSTLFNAFSRTIANMASKPFSEPMRWSEIDPVVEEWFDNIDLQGRNLQTFSMEVFEAGLTYGLTHVLVDYPKTTAADGTSLAPTLADERILGVRPYFIHIKPTAVLGWISDKVNGAETLTQVRILEHVSVPDGPYATKLVEQVRLLTPGAWEVHRQDPTSKEWVKADEGMTSLNYIPLVTFYTNRTGFMQATPPLGDLADLNVQHWNLASDSYALLHTASVPILALTGVDETTKIVVGAKAALMLPLGASAQYVEHSGAAIGAGRQALIDLEERMRTMGAELLVSKPGDMTATQSSIDTAQAQCQLAAMAEAFEDVLDSAIDTAAEWVGLGDQGDVDIFDDFSAAPVQGAAVQPFVAALVTLVASDMLSKETAFKELQRYGVINDDIDFEAEAEKISAADPVLLGTPLPLGNTVKVDQTAEA
jgi:hypothetical protein